MGGFANQAWGKLWNMHHETKKTLMLFSQTSVSSENGTSISKDKKSVKPDPNQKPHRSLRQNIGLWLGPLLFMLILFGLSPEGMSKEALAVLASTAWIATWWITEAIPIPATSLLPIILFPLTGAVTEGITSAYADTTIFLFLGGFLLAIALEKWNLHRRMALNIILFVGTSTQRIVLGFMIATGFLSMWISNTATAMMMMPIALAVIKHVDDSIPGKSGEETNFGKAMMLGVAYSASIGGLGTLIGTPPNTIFAGVVKELYKIDLSFGIWMLFGVPLAVILLAAVWIYLVKMAFPLKLKEIPGGKSILQSQKAELGRISFEEKLVLTVFTVTALAWISRTFILMDYIPFLDDTIIAITAAVLLFILPSKQANDGKLLNWNDAKNIPWGILLLFGGGLAIAKGFKDSGLAQWIGEQLTILQGVQFIVIIAVVTALVIFLTEITSNTATATMMFPIMASLAYALDVHPYALMVAAGIAASCAFMLPVATPPNAIVFGSGLIKINDMAKAGFWINIVCIGFITFMIYVFMPVVWGIDLNVFPQELK
ncbi:sodium-dependent dicarboxylate transporter 2/3/5 [Bacillus ectoiniformans]|uniref:SLC13 family permease n=1 Tax=Bacillus ectoiniformans TaxID=1494429 RepID=UPI00195F1692|nr:DASS family sodium-coupled anion symporter [Bacillus ectoiniformans]MBM7649519.1 sodium-dependent dicarboxylate transporter 2/3/5 [Bacillus ectoiniformans]